MTAAIANSYGLESVVTPSVLEDMVWNLQTWPLDLVEWPTHNSHRLVCVCLCGGSTLKYLAAVLRSSK
jgi:hypothetical protein